MSQLQVNNITDTGGHTLLGRKNAIINGNFDVWQRGTSQTALGYGSADRWSFIFSTTTQTTTQQAFTLGQTDVPYNPKYYARNVVSTGGTAASLSYMMQKIEGVESFAGETVTLSFYAKADASKNIAVEFFQNFGTTGSPSTSVTGIEVTTVSLTASWVKYTVTADIPSITGKTLGTDGNDYLAVAIWLDAGSDSNARTNSLGNQSGTFDIAQVQLEKGSVATDFERRSYGEELALCQRYYYRLTTTGAFSPFCSGGYANSATEARDLIIHPVRMRSKPTYAGAAASLFTLLQAGANKTVSAIALVATNTDITRLGITIASGAIGGGGILTSNSSSETYVALDAEL